MPMLTPSRIAIIVVALTFFSFLYTLGFPTQLAQPAQPIIDHYDHKNVHTEPIVPAPIIPTPTPTRHATLAAQITHGERPGEEDESRWNDATKTAGQAGTPEATNTSIAEYEKDGGRWEDKDKLKAEKSGEKQEVSTTPIPTTLLTHAIPIPSGLNATNATNYASTPTEAPSQAHLSKLCKEVQGAPNVMVVMRTSKTEIQERLPAHIKGLLSCVPNFAIFSDHDGEIEGIKVHNALDSIAFETKRTHDEFQEYQLMHADPEHKPDASKTKNLDKWKFLPMVYKAYHLKPDARFYMFIEADTSLSWTNTLQWINRLDYRIPYYSGAPTFINSVQLAQRGSGIMLSQGALRRYVKSYDEKYISKWEFELGKGCCGDLALAQALGDAHVEFYSSWPLMQGEQPSSLDYTQKQWCSPAVTWHHTNADVLDEIWTTQQAWIKEHGWDVPFLFRDAFQSLVIPQMAAKKDKWDNLSQDTKIVAPQGRQKQLKEEEERSEQHAQDEEAKKDNHKPTPFADPPHHVRSIFARHDDKDKKEEVDWDKLAETFKEAADSAERCQKSCEQIEDCLQWRYKALGDGECHLGKVLRLGKKVEEKDDPWTSGWMIERMKKVTDGWACKEVNWRFYQ
jgi:hypothetical protein